MFDVSQSIGLIQNLNIVWPFFNTNHMKINFDIKIPNYTRNYQIDEIVCMHSWQRDNGKWLINSGCSGTLSVDISIHARRQLCAMSKLCCTIWKQLVVIICQFQNAWNTELQTSQDTRSIFLNSKDVHL